MYLNHVVANWPVSFDMLEADWPIHFAQAFAYPWPLTSVSVRGHLLSLAHAVFVWIAERTGRVSWFALAE